MRYVPLALALIGLGLLVFGVVSLVITRQPTDLNTWALYVGLGMAAAGRLIQLVTKFVSDVRGPIEPVKRSAHTKTVSPALAWGILGGILLIGVIAVCWVRFFR
jgi:hypothetical protein